MLVQKRGRGFPLPPHGLCEYFQYSLFYAFFSQGGILIVPIAAACGKIVTL